VAQTLTAYQSGSAYTTPGVNLISLPVSQEVVDGSGSPKSLTCYSYDQSLSSNYTPSLYDPTEQRRRAGNASTVSVLAERHGKLSRCGTTTMLSTAYTYEHRGATSCRWWTRAG